MSQRRMSGAVPDKDRPKLQELRAMQFGDMPPEEQQPAAQPEEAVQTAEEPQLAPASEGPSTRSVVRLPPSRDPHNPPGYPPGAIIPVIPLRRPGEAISPLSTRSPVQARGAIQTQTQTPTTPAESQRPAQVPSTPAPSQRPTQAPTTPHAMQTPAQAQVPISAHAQPPTHTPSASQHAINIPTMPQAMQGHGSPYGQSPTDRRGSYPSYPQRQGSFHSEHPYVSQQAPYAGMEVGYGQPQQPGHGHGPGPTHPMPIPGASQHAQSPYASHRTQSSSYGSQYPPYQSPAGPMGQQHVGYTPAGPVVSQQPEQMSAYGPQPGQGQGQGRPSSYGMPPPSRFSDGTGQFFFPSTRRQPLDLVPEEELAGSSRAPGARHSRAVVISAVKGARVEKSRAFSKASNSSSSTGLSDTRSKKSDGSTERAARRESPEQRVAKLAKSLNSAVLNNATPDFQPAAQAVQVAQNRNVRIKRARTAAEQAELEAEVLASAERDIVFSGLPDTAAAAREAGWSRPTVRQQDLFRQIIDRSHGLPLLRRSGYRGTDTAETFLPDPTDPNSLPRVVAMDCEMVGVEGHPGGQYTVRICLVDVLTGEVLMDHVILPPAGVRITDWRTQFSGMTQAAMDLYIRDGRTVQGHEGAINFMQQILDNRAHFVGHALHNDFNALGITHNNIIDTVLIMQEAVTDQMAAVREPGRCGGMWGLANLCRRFLNRDVQVGHHSCLEDTYAARELVLFFALNGSALQAVTTWAREQVNARTFTVFYDPPKEQAAENQQPENQQEGNQQGGNQQGEDQRK
ncbi:hypothetical protein BJY00DRAFT_318770 [Aspergillus carlsbadensis]|nr:hypothetical protein BJY00DRAFT_318770 [Aspergillus carlsbadensis]